MFVLKFPDQQVLGPLSVRQKSHHTGHSCVLCSLSAVVCNGRTGVHCVAVCYRHAHTGGGLVGQVWSRRLLFTLVEGDVAIWTVIMKIVTTVALLLLLCLPATGELLFRPDSQAGNTGETVNPPLIVLWFSPSSAQSGAFG